MKGLEIVNMIKTEDGYVEQSELDEKQAKEAAEQIQDRFMSHFPYEKDKTASAVSREDKHIKKQITA